MKEKLKIIAVVGPTASGKSSLAVKIAKKFDGEIISVDSRQVYKDLNVATNKITSEEMSGIPHHLLSIAPPEKRYSVAEFKRDADKKIDEITKRGKIPILVGGTGYYIETVAYGIERPEVPPNKKLREKLKGKSLKELQKKLQNLDPDRYGTVDKQNPRRLIRAIEIAKSLGKVPKLRKERPYDVLLIGLKLTKEDLGEKIRESVRNRMKKGMVEEAQNLLKKGLSPERMREIGLEYGILADFLEEKIKEEEIPEKVFVADRQYAKRQMTWFQRDKNINWFHPGNYEKIEKEVNKFLQSYE